MMQVCVFDERIQFFPFVILLLLLLEGSGFSKKNWANIRMFCFVLVDEDENFLFFVISFVFQASAPVGSGAAKAVDTNLPSSCVVFCFLIGGASSKETSSSSTSPIE